MNKSTEFTIKRKIGNTEYTVKAEYATVATENAAKKMRRLILWDLKNDKNITKKS